MGSIFATRRNGTKVIRPRYELKLPAPLTAIDRRNIDTLVRMHDATAVSLAPPAECIAWTRRLQYAQVEDVLRALSAGRSSDPRRRDEFDDDVRWVRDDDGVPGMRLSDICEEFGWDHARVRARLLKIAARAVAGKRRRVATVTRARRPQRTMAVA